MVRTLVADDIIILIFVTIFQQKSGSRWLMVAIAVTVLLIIENLCEQVTADKKQSSWTDALYPSYWAWVPMRNFK
jgi:hypothetical protein